MSGILIFVAAILIVVMIGTFLASYLSKPLYQSQIQIQIERESNSVTIEDIFGIAASEQEFLKTQYELLRSRGLSLADAGEVLVGRRR